MQTRNPNRASPSGVTAPRDRMRWAWALVGCALTCAPPVAWQAAPAQPIEPPAGRAAAAMTQTEDRLIAVIARGHHFDLAIEDVCGEDFPPANRERIHRATDRLTRALMARAALLDDERDRLDIEARELAARELARDPQHVMMLALYGGMSDAERSTRCLAYTDDVVVFWEAYVERELDPSAVKPSVE